MKYGYARASSNDQDTAIQVAALVDAGCEVIRTEKASGVSLNNREELTTLMEFLRPGDELVITRIDRLARSLRDLENLVYELDQKGVVLSATEQAIDTSTNEGRCFISMLGIFAQFEHSIRYERQMEGVKKAKAEGKYKGRKPSVHQDSHDTS
jgi:DNA invertase Pin-like site-specific DNA recombinase